MNSQHGAPRERPHEPVADLLGMDVGVVEPGHCEISLTVRPEMLNGHGVCHGGILFTLADMAMALATNAGESTNVATHAEIDFVEAVQPGTRLVASAQRRHSRGKQTITDIRISDSDGRVVAEFRGRTLAVGSNRPSGSSP